MTSTTSNMTQRVFVSGKVQKVGFRDWVVRHAKALGLIGWVRNRTDGRLEILIIGDSDASTALIDKLREGPPLARVDHIEAHADDERPPRASPSGLPCGNDRQRRPDPQGDYLRPGRGAGILGGRCERQDHPPDGMPANEAYGARRPAAFGDEVRSETVDGLTVGPAKL